MFGAAPKPAGKDAAAAKPAITPAPVLAATPAPGPALALDPASIAKQNLLDRIRAARTSTVSGSRPGK
jgi:hypothetical protein